MAARVRRAAGWLLAGMMAVALGVPGGCSGRDGPTTYPVKGRVVHPGGKPWTRGQITFRSVDDPATLAAGDIQPDGGFTLTTHYLVNGQPRTKPGAPPGNYTATVAESTAAERGDNPATPPVVLAKTYAVEAGENSLLIEAPRPGRR